MARDFFDVEDFANARETVKIALDLTGESAVAFKAYASEINAALKAKGKPDMSVNEIAALVIKRYAVSAGQAKANKEAQKKREERARAKKASAFSHAAE